MLWLTDMEKAMKELSPFYIQKALNQILGLIKNAFRLQNELFRVETK
jgi:hypothetical protein